MIGDKLFAAVMALLTGGILGLSIWLTPDQRGFGTHEQLGLSPCLHYVQQGVPCVSCGMTTAFAYGARGQVLSAWDSNPGGLILFGCTLLLFGSAIHSLLTGRPLLRIITWPSVRYGVVLVVVVTLLAWWLRFRALQGT